MKEAKKNWEWNERKIENERIERKKKVAWKNDEKRGKFDKEKIPTVKKNLWERKMDERKRKQIVKERDMKEKKKKYLK